MRQALQGLAAFHLNSPMGWMMSVPLEEMKGLCSLPRSHSWQVELELKPAFFLCLPVWPFGSKKPVESQDDFVAPLLASEFFHSPTDAKIVQLMFLFFAT